METTVQRFETGISENNLRHWGMLHAVKEFLQNAVYAKSILGDEISIKHENGMAIIHNTPHGFSRGKLLIGESDQADVTGAPGQYGEGQKVAMAVARREGAYCYVETNGFSVRPELEPSSLDESVNSLVFYIEDTENNKGTTAFIECTEEVLEEAKSYFAILQGVDDSVTKMDTIMKDHKGIYANGVKVTETEAIYGYNFTDASLINRDRSTVDMSLLRSNTSNLLSSTEDEEVITSVIQHLDDDSLLESQSGIYNSSSLPLWKKVIEKVLGKKVSLSTGGQSDTKARYKGFKLISVPRNWKYFFNTYLDIHPSNELRETTVDANKHKKATPEENKNLGWAKRLVKLYYADYGTVRVSEEVLDEFSNRCLGLYDREKDTIWLKRSILSDKEELFKTLLHETIHRETGADDNTEQFTNGWEDACWGILNRGKS